MHVTMCTECKSQYRIPASHLDIVSGRSVSCKKCRARFIVNIIEMPDPVETDDGGSEETTSSAVSHERDHRETTGAEQAARPARRSQAEIRTEQIKSLKSNFRLLHSRLSEINQDKTSTEEDVRRWVVDALRNVFGYEDRDIRTEERANDRKTDITLRIADANPTVVIEVKSIRHSLNQRVIDQVASYAAVLNAPYAVITNGDAWILFKCGMKSGKQKLIEIFNIALLDEDGISEEDSKTLFLLTKRAISSGYTERQCHLTAAVQPARLIKAFLDESVLSKLKRTISMQYEEETGIKIDLDTDVILEHFKGFLIPDDL